MVQDTPSSQDAPAHQIWDSYLKEYRRYAPDTKRDGHAITIHSFGGIKMLTGTKSIKLEDLKVLRRSPDLLNNVKIGQGQLHLIMEQILFYHICCRHFGQVT